MSTTKAYSADLLSWAGVNDAWSLYTLALQNCRTTIITGPPRTGKTYTPFTLFRDKVVSVTLDGDFCSQELRGSYVPEGNQFVWRDAVGIQAARSGKVPVINELQRASQAVQDSFLALAESTESAKISLPSGEVVSPHPDFKIIATSNEDYANLDPAVLARFAAKIRVTEPHPRLIDRLNNRSQGLGNAVKESYKSPTPINAMAATAIVDMTDKGVSREAACLLALGSENAQNFLTAWKLTV